MVKSTSKPSSSIEFFKIFFSRFSSRQLSFPPAFVDRLDRTIPEKATLKDHTEKIWNVQLETSARKLIIKKGWEEFVRHHCLVDADFLVFIYDGTPNFLVKVYDRNGLKKEKVLADKDCRFHVKEEIETEEGETMNQNHSTSGFKRKCFSTACKPTQKSPGALLYDAPENPHFVVLMTKSSRYSLYVHRSVLKEHNIKLQEDMKLRDETGKLWPVKVSCKNNGLIKIRNGWREFHVNQKVAFRDMFIFEFIPTRDDVIQVQIVRRKT